MQATDPVQLMTSLRMLWPDSISALLEGGQDDPGLFVKRERERVIVCVCVCVNVSQRERVREKQRE